MQVIATQHQHNMRTGKQSCEVHSVFLLRVVGDFGAAPVDVVDAMVADLLVVAAPPPYIYRE